MQRIENWNEIRRLIDQCEEAYHVSRPRNSKQSLEFFKKEAYAGFRLHHHDFPRGGTTVPREKLDLEFIVSRFVAGTHRRGTPSAAFVRDGQKIWLAHSGRVHNNRPPFGDPDTTVSTAAGIKKYFLVTAVDHPHFFKQLVRFHERRKIFRSPIVDGSSTSSDSELSTNGKPDPGASIRHPRDASDVDPKHAGIVKALASSIDKLKMGWEVLKVSKVRPDILIGRNGYRILFEVKPDSRPMSICAAMGQLIYYSRFCKPHMKVIVVPELREQQMAEVVASQNLSVLPFEETGRKYSFPELSKLLTSM